MNKYQKLVQQQFLNNEEAVIKQLEKVYGQSQKDINQKISNLTFHIGKLQEEYDWMDDNDPEKEKVKSMIQSKIYQKQYQEALKGQIDGILQDMHKNAYKTVSDYLDKCYEDGFIGTMFDLQGQGIPLCFPLDQEAMVRAVQIDSKISKGLYSHLGEDVAKLKKHITSEISRGISSGMSFSQVAQQITFKMTGTYDNPGGSLAYASRIARTEGHRIQVQGGMDACYKAKEKGADVVKQWDSTLDSSTRKSHQQVDGEIRELDERFLNGLMFPGDPSGGAAEVVNCRCALLQRARWALGDGFTKHDNFSGELKQFDNPETYNEFKKAYFSKENKDFMKYVGELEDQYGTKDFQKLLSALDDNEYERFVQLQDARPMFSGMYRGDSVVKNKKILENSVNSDIMKSGQTKAFTKVKVEDIPPMDEKKFNTIKGNLEKQGVAVIQDADGDDYLRYMGAEAMTLSDGSAVIFQSGRTPSASATYEEVIHIAQIRKKGVIESSGDIQGTIEYLNREIEANEKLIRNQKAYKLTNKDVESVQENLDAYYKKLEETKSSV